MQPKLREVTNDLIALAGRSDWRGSCAQLCWTTLPGAALALWARYRETFGGGTTFVTVTVVTMVSGTLAPRPPHPGRGWRSGRLIGGLAAFGVPAALDCAVGATVSTIDLMATGIRRLAGDTAG